MKSELLKRIYRYLLFFILVAFVVTCTMILFISTLSREWNVTFTLESMRRAAGITFLNVLFLSFLFTVLDILRRRLTTDRIVVRIRDAVREITKGNFSVRISKKGLWGLDSHYVEIIDCINRMAEDLSSLETLRTDFIANVSHEMKTPLAVMQNYGTLLEAKELDDRKRVEYARSIIDSTHRMTNMIMNILQLDKLENQKIFPEGKTYSLSEQLTLSLLQYENVWEKRNIEIDTDIPDRVMIKADENLLSLVWNNLLSNAFKFIPDGGKVSLTLHDEDGYAVVEVKDSGIGMTKETGEHVFEKFYQGDKSHSGQGNGLGLALVKRIIDIMKGEITVESTLGKGSTFTVKIRKNSEEKA